MTAGPADPEAPSGPAGQADILDAARPEAGSALAGAARPVPAISVIVPVYNVAGYVGPCLESLRAQSLADFEAIVVDDGSTDASRAEAEAAIAGDPRFRIVARPNGGLSAARNTGLTEARAQIIGFVDSDDRVAPDYLARLHAALIESGAQMAACAVLLCPEGGRPRPHPAIHGARHPLGEGPWLRLPLADFSAQAAVWPSAWNKLYRRSLLAGMRFVEGTHYEDHPWFQEAAARTDALAYVPEPLYWQTQGRPGQITRDDSERIFEQYRVLERVETIMAASARPGAREGLERLASRLIFERQGAIGDPARRARFLAEGRRFLAERGLAYSPEWDREMARGLGLTLAGEVPLSVVIPADRAGPALARSLHGLARQRMPDAEVLIVQVGADEAARRALLAAAEGLAGASVLAVGGAEPGEARSRGLAAARGRLVLFLDAGDSHLPGTLWLWTEAMLRSGADMGVSRFRIGGPKGKIHAGTHDGGAPEGGPLAPPPQEPLDRIALPPVTLSPERALRLHPLPAARIYRRAFLQAEGLAFPREPLGAWGLTICAAAAAGRVQPLPWPGAVQSIAEDSRRLWHAPVEAARLRSALERLGPRLDPLLPRARWLPLLMARALWEKLNFARFESPAAQAAWIAGARRAVADLPLGEAPLDPFVGPRVRALFPDGRP